MIYCLTFYY